MSVRTSLPARVAAVLSAVVLMLVFAGSASARRRHTPVPRCSWVSSTLVQRTFNLAVRARKPAWATQIAPVLTCGFNETQPNLQIAGQPIVTVQFRELQRFKVSKALTFVPHLGSCVMRSSCPVPHKPAWVYIQQTSGSGSFGPYVDALQLRVEDGLNTIVITVQSPYGSLPVTNELAAAEQLARKLLPRFRFR